MFFFGEAVDFEGRRLRRRKVKIARSRVLDGFAEFRMVFFIGFSVKSDAEK